MGDVPKLHHQASVTHLEGRKVLFEAILWLAVWMIISPSIIIQIKSLISTAAFAFPYSWGFLGFSNLVTFAASWVAVQIADKFITNGKTSAVDVDWGKGCTLGVLQGLEVGLGAVVIRAISVELRTEIHMMAPAVMYVGGLLAGLESCAPVLVLSVVLITLGGIMSVSGQMHGTTDYMLVPVAILSALCASGRWVLTQFWLAPKGSPERPSPLLLLCRMSPATGVTGLLGAAIFEPQMYQALGDLPEPSAVWCRILFIGVSVVAMISAELRVCQLMSALLLGMMTPLHNVTIILWGIYSSGTTNVSLYNWGGITCCTAATILYSWARHEETKKAHARELLMPTDMHKIEEDYVPL